MFMIFYERFSLIVFSEVTGSRKKKIHLPENSIALFLCHRWLHERIVGQSPDFLENGKRNSVSGKFSNDRVTKTDQRLRRNALTKL